ncbi:tyrosine-type recombinase/integrase [Stenotrophomonas sp. AR029]|uniref:tyrosine-type recombinase/integrase n=1 Tax=Stenotrophomonas sp. AR029 TaxID=3398601 RepID=UPI0039C76257
MSPGYTISVGLHWGDHPMLLLTVKVRDPSVFSRFLPGGTQLGANIASRLPEGFPLLIDGEGKLNWACFCYLLEKYRIDSARDRRRTLQTYAEGLKDWLQHLETQDVDWTRPPPVALSDFRRSMAQGIGRRHPASNATVNLRTAIVRDFYAFLADWTRWRLHHPSEEIDRYPIDRFLHAASKVAAAKAYKKAPKALSAQDAQRISAGLKLPYSLMFKWCVATGLRRTNVANLTIAQLPEEFEEIAYIRLIVKGGKPLDVPVTRALMSATWDYVETVRPRLLSRTRIETGHLFVNEKGMPATSSSYYSAFRRAAMLAGVNASPHSARHTFAAHMNAALERCAANGVGINPTKVLQHILGHSSPATTELYLETVKAMDLGVLRALIEVQESLE